MTCGAPICTLCRPFCAALNIPCASMKRILRSKNGIFANKAYIGFDSVYREATPKAWLLYIPTSEDSIDERSMHGFEYSPQSGGSSLTGGKARTLRRSIPLTSYSSNKKAPERVPFCLEQMTGRWRSHLSIGFDSPHILFVKQKGTRKGAFLFGADDGNRTFVESLFMGIFWHFEHRKNTNHIKLHNFSRTF